MLQCHVHTGKKVHVVDDEDDEDGKETKLLLATVVLTGA